MVELVVLGALAFCALVVIGTLIAAASMLGWLVWLPFRLLGLLFRGLGLLIALPFMILGLVVGVLALGAGAVALLLPLFPLALLVFAVVWLIRRSGRRPITS